MTPLAKITLGTLGGGTAAVGGHEVYAFATGKPGLIIHRFESSSNDSSSTTEQSGEQTTKKQITDLLEELKKGCEIKVKETPEREINVDNEKGLSNLLTVLGTIGDNCKTARDSKIKKLLINTDQTWSIYVSTDDEIQTVIGNDFGCEIKVRTGEGSTNQEISSVVEEADKTSLLAKLKELKTGECQGSKDPKTTIILKKKDTTWEKMSEKDQILALTKDTTNFKCEIKIKTSENKLKAIDDKTTGTEIEGLLEKLEGLKTSDCQSSIAQKIHKVFENKTQGGSGWDEVQSEKEKVDAWLASESKFSGESQICELKIFSSDLTYKSISSDSPITGLYDFLEKDSTVKDTCKTGTTTNKQEIVIHKESNVWKILDEKKQILELMKDNNIFKCKIKIKNANDEGIAEINEQTEATLIEGLIKYLKENKSTECNGSSEKDLVLKKGDGNTWSIYSTIDQINNLKSTLETVCTVQIQDSKGSSKTLSDSLDSTSLNNLLKQMQESKDHCTGSVSDPKKTVTFKEENSNNAWTTTKTS